MRPAILGGVIAAILLGAGALAGLPRRAGQRCAPARQAHLPRRRLELRPPNAEGVLEFSFAEAFARVDVKNLPPTDGYTYEGWLTGGPTPRSSSATIEVDASGIGVLETKLTGLASYEYDLFVVAARGAGAAEDALPADRSIAGRFAVIADATGTAAAGRPPRARSPRRARNRQLRARANGSVALSHASPPAAGLALILLSLNRRRSRPMIKGLYSAFTAMEAAWRYQDVLANNIANSNTTGLQA